MEKLLESTRMLVALRATHARRHCAFGELKESGGTSGRPQGDLRAASKRSQCSLGLRPQQTFWGRMGTLDDLKGIQKPEATSGWPPSGLQVASAFGLGLSRHLEDVLGTLEYLWRLYKQGLNFSDIHTHTMQISYKIDICKELPLSKRQRTEY